MNSISMTPEGHDNLVKELDGLKAQRTDVVAAIAHARAKGDLKENAEYHAAREKQGMLEAKIKLLEGKLACANVIDPSDAPEGVVVMGSVVEVTNLGTKKVTKYTLVGPGEDDLMSNKILTTSPLGQSLIRKAKGDKITFETPRGAVKMKIKSIK